MRTVVPGPCPVCQTEINYLYLTDEIPYFSEILIISALCPSCGYRLADTQILRNSEPTRWELGIETPDDMMIRVIRRYERYNHDPGGRDTDRSRSCL